MLKLTLVCETPESIIKQWVNVFFDFEGNASQWSREKGRKQWQALVGTPPPETIKEAISREGELSMSLPRKIEVVQNGKWLNVHSWEVRPWNESRDDSNDGQEPLFNIPF